MSDSRAVVLVSGGLDSATALAIARSQGFECYALSVAYGQRHVIELEAAARVAKALGAREHRVMSVDLAHIGGSALTDSAIPVPEAPAVSAPAAYSTAAGTSAPNAPTLDAPSPDLAPAAAPPAGIPVTYVPARNTMMLSLALAWAEVLEARDIFIGVNAVDYSGYPDCRPQFIAAFEALASLATKAGVEGHPCRIHTPLISWSKGRIIEEGSRLGVDYSLTLSCYQPDGQGRACGRCDSCRLRKAGFEAASIPDPTSYQPL